MLKKATGTMLVLFISSCGWGVNQTPKQAENSPNIVKVEASKEKGVQPADLENLFVTKVSEKKGASIYFKINKPKDGFAVKANVNGNVAKTSADIANYLVYLVKSVTTTGYPAGDDPLGTSDLVAGPFTIATSGSSQNVRFDNIPSAGALAYYVAVRAQDAGSNDLIKDNNGGPAWTGITASTPKVAVSTGDGIVVDAALTVSSITPLSVTPNLIDAVGAVLETTITPNDGAAIPPITATGF